MKKRPKVVAFHLPQFHCIPENDEWWGKGFTEWTNTRKAKPLFKGHNQPRTPLNEHYYDLSRLEDLIWEMELAKAYKLDAFCYYHYWFNGKLLLEKPLELMRNLPERIPYFFCWANEPWSRTWDGSKEVLIDQVYTGQKDWDAHYNYLHKFFKDAQYLKIDNRPVLVIYRTTHIPACDEMIEYWDMRCKENGFKGIYIIEEKNGFQKDVHCKNSSGFLEFEPLFTTWNLRKKERAIDYIKAFAFNITHGTRIKTHDFDQYWKNILTRKRSISNKSISVGAFVDWDNTARKGIKGTFFVGSTPKKFENYLRKQLHIAAELECPFVFINAWNEWGEGTYLEPDEKNGYKYLEALKSAIDAQ